MWLHHYLLEDKPLRRCPECYGDLTEEGGVDVTLCSDSGHNWVEPARLGLDGFLIDCPDAEDGLHSCTECGHCGEMLSNMEGVAEIIVEGRW